MDGATIEVNTVEFEAAMQRLRDGVRRGIIDPAYGTLGVQGRLLAERAQTFTPPKNAGQGRAAATKDLMAVYWPVSHTTFREKSLRRIVQKDDRSAWNIVSRRFGGMSPLRNTDAIGFSPERHARLRNRRGRVRSRRSNLGSVTLGPEGIKSRAYIKDILKRVGWAKAGWNAGIVGLGGVVKGAWISRHAQIRGRLFDGRNDPDPYIRVLNDTGWAQSRGGTEGNRILRNAIAARARDMQSYFDRMMRVAAKASGG